MFGEDDERKSQEDVLVDPPEAELALFGQSVAEATDEDGQPATPAAASVRRSWGLLELWER